MGWSYLEKAPSRLTKLLICFTIYVFYKVDNSLESMGKREAVGNLLNIT